MTNSKLDEIVTQLNNIKSAAIFCHVRPDGDALGAGMALCIILKNLGKKAVFCCDERPPEKFMFLPSMEEVKCSLPQNTSFDTLICVDCADVTRIGSNSDTFVKFKGCTINIDHHTTNPKYAKFNYVSERTATCECLTEIFRYAGYTITKEIADLLMLGLITDSGNFTHNDVTENTFKVASYLKACNADVHSINYYMYQRQPKSRALLCGQVMQSMRFRLSDKVAIIIIYQQDLKNFGADNSLTEGFVDFPLTIDTVEVAVSILEVKKNQFKISLRSKGKVNVSAVASTFGGGGHVLASGCMLFGELEDVIDRLVFVIDQNL